MSKKALVILSVTWLVILVAGVSVTLTLSICGVTLSGGTARSEGYTVTQDEYEMIERYARVEEVYDILKTQYVEEIPDETLLTGAVQGMMASVDDPYTYYYTPSEMSEETEREEGNYEGLGIQISLTENKTILVSRVFKDTPAQAAGIRAGDTLVSINGTPVFGETSKDLSDAVAMIKDDPDGVVTLSLTRDGDAYEVDVRRDSVSVNRVEYRMLDDEIGYVMLYEFLGDAVDGFNEAIAALQAQGMKALVLDVRSNPGGMLGTVLDISDTLLPKGLIVYIEDRNGKRASYYSDAKCLDLPMAVLVNGNSASASEVLTGALQDHGVAIVVGETTFGKGIVQSLYDFPSDGAGMQLTTARYYTPNGRFIHGVGITPDIEVTLEAGYDPSLNDPDPTRDAQLAAAIDAIRAKLAGQAAE